MTDAMIRFYCAPPALESLFEDEFCRHLDGGLERPVHRAPVVEDPGHAIGGLPMLLRRVKPESNMDAPDDEDALV